MSRRFTSRERVALFVGAGGRCEDCGVDLAKGWHSDHVIPWSAGGPTDVTNGRALCPSCNLRKGPFLMRPLRQWQVNALSLLRDHAGADFLAVATPAAGKTTFALEAIRREHPAQIVVVVPTTRLRHQWADAAHAFGINLDPYFESSNGRPAADYQGIVVTYQAVASSSHLYRAYVGNAPTFVVLDEVHHCGDGRRWGESVRSAFEPAVRRLMLSGTPFRSDEAQIPFIEYEPVSDSDGCLTSRADFRYEYGAALRDGIVRAVEFSFYDCTAQWLDADETISKRLKESHDRHEGRALASTLLPESDWIDLALTQAHAQLERIRGDIPDAGGLVIASDIEHAATIAPRLSRIAGVSVPVATSDKAEAVSIIDGFAASTAPWLVAVNMVSEGVDIPRLIVGVYATSTRTPMFFRQAVGRFVRTRGDESDSHTALLVLPSAPTLLELANTIEIERDHVIEEFAAGADDDSDDHHGDEREPSDQDGRILPAIDGRHDQSVLNGQSINPADLAKAELLMGRYGVTGSPTQVAMMLRDALVVAPVVAAEPTPSPVDVQPVYQERDRLLAKLHPLVRSYAARTYSADVDKRARYKAVWKALNNAVDGVPLANASNDGIRRRSILIRKWMSDENA